MNFTNMGTEGLQFDPAWMDTAASNMDWVSCVVVVIHESCAFGKLTISAALPRHIAGSQS